MLTEGVHRMSKMKENVVEEAKKSQQKASHFWERNKLWILGSIILGFVVVGTLFMIYVEEYDGASAFEWNFVTLSTVGYGDVTPHSKGGKVFVVVYIIFGVSCMVYFGTGMHMHMFLSVQCLYGI